MKYVFPCVMLISGVGLILHDQTLIGCLLAFFAAVTFDDLTKSDRS